MRRLSSSAGFFLLLHASYVWLYALSRKVMHQGQHAAAVAAAPGRGMAWRCMGPGLPGRAPAPARVAAPPLAAFQIADASLEEV